MAKDSRPLNKSNEDNSYFTDDDFLDLSSTPDVDSFLDDTSLDNFDACSSQDCTGLIPRGSVHEKTIDAYNVIYDFGSPK